MQQPPKPIDLTPMSDDARATFIGRVLMLLRASAFRRRASWGRALVVFTPEAKRVTSRADYAGWLSANALDVPAHECRARRVPPGHVLLWLEYEGKSGAGAGLALVDLEGEIDRLTSVEKKSAPDPRFETQT